MRSCPAQSRFEFIEATHDDGLAIIALNRPAKRNAVNVSILDELTRALTDAEHASEVSAVILTGRGTTFCSGADRSSVAGLTGEALARAFAPVAVHIARGITRLMFCLVSMTKPVIGAINGHAVGGGFIATLGCDLQVASDEARFWMPEFGMGRAVGAPSMATLVACVGPLVAKEIVLTGRRLVASDLAAMGLVSRVVPADAVMEVAIGLARALAQTDPKIFASVKSRANEPLVSIWQTALETPECES